MPSEYTRRSFLRAALLGGSACAAAAVLPAFWPLKVLADSTEDRPVVQQSALFMGTVVSISVAGCPQSLAEDAIAAAFAVGRQQEAVFSRHDAASPLSALNSTGRLTHAPQALTALLQEARRVGRLSGGAFDISVLPLISLLEEHRGQDGRTALSAAAVQDALARTGQDQWQISGDSVLFKRAGMGMTLDGIAKGHIAQLMSASLLASGCQNHLVNAGGDMVIAGRRSAARPWTVAVEDPQGRGRYPQVLALPQGGAVATSGTYEVFYDAAQKTNHLVSPATGQSSTLLSVTVTAPQGFLADALATAMSIMPPRDALLLADSVPQCACCLVRKDGLVQHSTRWQGQKA